MQDVSGWSVQEYVNVPSDTPRLRFAWPADGAVLQPGQIVTLCNSRAGEFLQQQCTSTADLGVNGDDALLLLDANDNVMVRPPPPGVKVRPAMSDSTDTGNVRG